MFLTNPQTNTNFKSSSCHKTSKLLKVTNETFFFFFSWNVKNWSLTDSTSCLIKRARSSLVDIPSKVLQSSGTHKCPQRNYPKKMFAVLSKELFKKYRRIIRYENMPRFIKYIFELFLWMIKLRGVLNPVVQWHSSRPRMKS